MSKLTEAEWLSADHPKGMLDVVRQISERKLRLFTTAACRRVWPLLDGVLRGVVDLNELFADGLVAEDELAEARTAVGQRSLAGIAVSHATRVPIRSGLMTFVDVVGQTAACPAPGEYDPEKWGAEWLAHCTLLREIFGNPFRPVAFEAAWRTSTAVALARQMYESRDFGNMPILADALQDAGCESDDVLSHCRDPEQPHVRGCWVVDLVLGKS